MPYADPERLRAYRQYYYHSVDKEKRKARAKRDWANRDLAHQRALRRKRRYGIAADEFDRLAAMQGGVCALCHKKPPTDVDHCHATNRVRGLLCRACNIGLGMFGDGIEGLSNAINYLKRSG